MKKAITWLAILALLILNYPIKGELQDGVYEVHNVAYALKIKWITRGMWK